MSDWTDPDESVSRRRFLRDAVAAGGTAALTACVDIELAGRSSDHPILPQGAADPTTLPDRQHEWVEYLVQDRFGNTKLPEHQTLLFLEYVGAGPTEAEREAVEHAFVTLEQAFQRGTGGNPRAVAHEGLLFVVGYAPRWFNRFDDSLPPSVDLPDPGEVIATLGESAEPDDYDAVIHMGSGIASVLLAAEEALRGELDEVNGVVVKDSFADVFRVAERRTGFIGQGQPARRYESDEIPESAPLSMGFNSGFRDNLPSEDAVTIQQGPFAGGSTMQVSRLTHDLDAWYEREKQDRVNLMFSPHHTLEDVGDVGENLGSHSGIETSHTEDLQAHAARNGIVGHSQKIATARDDAFNPTILRRDFDAHEEPGLHFDSWQRGISAFIEVREAMNGDDLDIDPHHNGILEFIEVTNRATYLMPPRTHRALPAPRP